ncbi:MAG: hypothetical protein EA403_12770 [Spirochaetaceae bacterium]|nr:MAG: hypothetical protein EA403_12770 [Spirochaetaceae bacterium]
MKPWRGLLIIGITLLIVFFGSWQSPGTGRRTADSRSSWLGHRALVVDASVPCELVVNRLVDAGIDPVIAECTTTVSINGFGRLVEYPLAAVPLRFDPVDPRVDPYIRGLPRWFRTTMNDEPAAIYYLAAEDRSIRLYRRVTTAMEGLGAAWRLPEWNHGRNLVFPLGFGVLVLLVFVHARGFRWAVIPAAAVLLPLNAVGSLSAFAAAGALLVAWSLGCGGSLLSLRARSVSGGTSRSVVVQASLRALLPVLGMAVAVSVVQPAEADEVASLLLGLAGLVGTTVLVTSLRVYRYRRCEHRLFVPVAITSSKPAVVLPVIVPLAIAVALAVPVAQRWLPAPSEIVLPQPAPAARPSVELTLSSLSHIWPPRGEDRLDTDGAPPDLAAFVAHRAFQEGFMYRRPFDLPAQDEEFSLPRFIQNEVAVEQTVETVAVYDDAWLARVFAERPSHAVEAILIAQNTPVRVEMRSVGAVYSSPVSLVRHAALLMMLVLPYALMWGGAHLFRTHALVQRSNRQHA